MFKNYKPTWMLKAVYQLTPEVLRQKGIKAVLVDLDNTLIAWNNPDGTPELKQWINEMKEAGILVMVVSNNKAERVYRAIKHLDLPYVSRAMKPFKKGFKEAQKKLNLQPDELLMVGDQLMTDIRGANRAGIRNVLVQPIVETDAWNTRFNRALERRIMKQLKKNHADMIWKEQLDG